MKAWMHKLKTRAKQLKTDIPAIILALKDPQTPWYAKVLAAITAAYALSPIDLIPDFIPVLGYLDDLVLLPILIALTITCIPQETFAQYRLQAQGMWDQGRPKKWYFAIPTVGIWIAILSLILYVLIW